MRATCEKEDGIYSWDLVRGIQWDEDFVHLSVFPDTNFVPYNLPKKGNTLEYLDSAPIPVVRGFFFVCGLSNSRAKKSCWLSF